MSASRFGLIGLVCGAALLGAVRLACADQDAAGFVRVKRAISFGRTSRLRWAQGRGHRRRPFEAGIYVIRVKFPPGLMTRPHFHAEDRHATVLAGTGTPAKVTASIRTTPCRSRRELHEAPRARAPL